MLSGNKFYHSHIRKAIVSFGSLFNNIHIDRVDSDGAIAQTLKVPLTYGPKSKILARVVTQPNLEDRPYKMVLPAMSFEITGFDYDPDRKFNNLNQSRAPNTATANKTQFAPAPWDMQIQLSIITKNQDDGLRIVEQILPYFNPAYSVVINDIPELNIQRNLPIQLVGVNFDDNYEGDVGETRYIIWTLAFNLKLNFYGPVSTQAIIKSATVNTHITSDETVTSGETYNVQVDPSNAEITDDWTFLETFDITY
jgi:hypothetical protein